ncbi:MAG: hypothetical protein Q9225_002434 [Loekoesia sp. 1 TL-2023]
MAQCPKKELEFIINHVVLPPDLPQEAENSQLVASAEQFLLKLVLTTVRQFQRRCAVENRPPWLVVEKMLSCWIATKPYKDLSGKLLKKATLDMRPGDALPVRIRAQNAGLILRHVNNAMNIECFELSPDSESVMSCKGSLRRHFPTHGVKIPTEVATDAKFCQELCITLSKLDLETVDEMMPKSRKAGSEWIEYRDTCHPGLVTELLMASLAAIGAPLKVLQVRKRIRDDVLWSGCFLPWRRSSLWLILRVGIQVTITREMDPAKAFTQYKSFMVYLLADILGQALRSGISDEHCKVIQMKVARRVAKLGNTCIPFVQETALAVAEQAARSQEDVWRKIQEKDADRKTQINLATVKDDTSLTLCKSRTALDIALHEDESNPHPAIPIPSVRHDWISISSDGVPVIKPSVELIEEKIYALAEFERWVWDSLPSWLQKALDQPYPAQCTSVAISGERYKTIALEAYSDCPEQLSLMLLVIGELWRAQDSIAGCLMPLLHQYSPEIPPGVFHTLLLPKKAHMQRLYDLEAYINDRHSNTNFVGLSILADPSTATTKCFASLYFEQSSDHQALHQDIVADANKKHDEKEREWEQGTNRYNDLKKQLDTHPMCETSVGPYGIEEHKADCQRCELKQAMDQLTISVFEWPLPKGEVQCRVVIFELQCPAIFAAWRNLTWTIIHDLGRLRDTLGKAPYNNLGSYPGLSHYFGPSSSRIELAASIKSVTASHYRQLHFPVQLEQVYCDHGLHWKLHDRARKLWISDQTERPSFSSKCQILLPEGPYKNLQYTVDSTTHAQNDVLAAQVECSSELNLHEYIAYGSLRSDGEQTQWLNIARELKAANLTWNTEAVCSLIQSSALQVGTSSTTFLRVAHSVLRIPDFCTELLSTIARVLQSIQANRQSVHTMYILVVLLLRVLSLSSNDLTAKALSLLRDCRSTVFRWSRGLQDALRVTTSSRKISSIRHSLLRVALLCKMTFDVDPEYVTQLVASPEDLSQWTASSMIVHDNTPGSGSSLPIDLRRSLVNDKKLSHALHRNLQILLTTSANAGLDYAVLQNWSGFQSPANSWAYVEGIEGRWIFKNTLSIHNRSQTVYYNILNGQLLVDGRPLGTLPKDYTADELFVRVFGAQILRISASDMVGMLYMTANEEYGYRFYFVMRAGHLVIRAKATSAVFELIPHNHFEGDFPTFLVEDFVHWLDIRTSEVEFRPLSRRWVTDAENWRLLYKPQGTSYLQNREGRLVDIRSRTHDNTVSVLGGLEKANFMHITRSVDGKFEVALPRLGFRFFMNSEGELECPEIRKVVDQDQSLGTMIGLRSRLVLCAKGDRSRSLDRTVLIPRGNVSAMREGSHLVVHIETSGREVQCLRYHHDAILGRLEGDGSVLSRFYQAYLHALTSYLLPDPLTGNLGTEESLGLLNEQILRCCRPLENAELDILKWVSALAPLRVFYPKYLQVMQQITWRGDLKPFSQHSEFTNVAERILAHTQRFNIFYHDSELPQSLEARGHQLLLQRAQLRDTAYLSIEYGGAQRSADYDKDYKARDVVRDGDRATRVFNISSLIVNWASDLAVTNGRLAQRWRAWRTVSGFGTIFNFTPSVSDLLKLDFSPSWAPLYEYCRRATRQDSQYKLLFLFGTIAYGSQISSADDLKTLLAFATNPSLRALPSFPNYQSFTLANGRTLNRSRLRSAIASHVKPCPSIRRTVPAQIRRQKLSEYQRESSANIDAATEFCENQWPRREPLSIPSNCAKWLMIQKANDAARDTFVEWHKNQECERHLEMIQGVLNTMTASTIHYIYEPKTWHQAELLCRTSFNQPLPTLSSLMAARLPTSLSTPPQFSIKQQAKVQATNRDLRSLIVSDVLTESNHDASMIRTQYRSDLIASLDAFQQHLEPGLPEEIPHAAMEEALSHYADCEKHCLKEYDLLCDTLRPKDTVCDLLKTAGFWPRLQRRNLLETIASSSRMAMSQEWKECVVITGTVISMLQRARRLVLAAEKLDTLSFFKEAENPGQLGWSANERSDWLLMEVENNLLIRQVQARVALEMIEPSDSSNTLMQLNMGEGKSSVIIPLIAAALADGTQLLRVVVLRSLTRQMQDTIIQRLGGLAKRPIYFMPFSRKTKISESIIRQMKALYIECMTRGGILLVQPEHVLSFQLMGIERLFSEGGTVAKKLLETQAWLHEHCRDVLDESDEILDVKFQLIYTLGTQRNMDGQPDRWLTMQCIFDIVQRQANLLKLLYPNKVEVEKQGSSSFPMIRLLSSEVRRILISKVFEDIYNSKVPGLILSNLPPNVKEAAASFIADEDIAETDCRIIQAHCSDDGIFLKKLLFVRGLIAGGILLHALHAKRWSVTYGLHPTRCLCAVPYRAKGVPAATAEFGHPDVTIALTCLSYYYSGLNGHQLRTCLEILQKADDPTAEYGTWTKADEGFPRHLTHWNAVNLEDQHQCDNQLFPALRYNKKAADFFLAHVVFPKEGKEFAQKLSTSGWDIPSRPESGKVTTGFSGTNDNRFLLPLSISQHDLPELQHTSGKVLEYVSRPENLSYYCAKDEGGVHLSSVGLLQFVNHLEPSVRVLIDVGAQILDLSNDQVVQNWLELVPDADAGVYFDEDDYAMVLTRAGKKERLVTSAFSNRMDRCLVYLDDVHTRAGTDLKLPRTVRAAVTLGPRLTKDRLVQACMRLRQLGHGQSLMFVAPPEVHQELVKNNPTAELNGLHVIGWALEQSCMQIERNQPLRVIQGLNYYRRREAMDELEQRLLTMSENDDTSSEDDEKSGENDETMSENDESSSKNLAQHLVEHEAQGLQDLYAPDAMREEDELDLVRSSRSKPDPEIQELIKLWDQLDPHAAQGARIHEEHEREVAQEVEQETQVERPPKATPEGRVLDPRIHAFIRSATLITFLPFAPVYPGILQQSSSAALLKGRTRAWSHLRVSRDFANTVKRDKTSPCDGYVRPVHWLLLPKEATVKGVLLISQYEVNQLFDEIYGPSSSVALVCYEPRVTRSMLSLDLSESHALPLAKEAWEKLSDEVRQELHLFAGQLYFTTFEEYEHLQKNLTTEYSAPLDFIKEWIGIRRKGQDYLRAHIGQVVNGRILHKEMFENDGGNDSGELFVN